MFYSQFILAKKGPLGTIWIAAHLERKLRKNQVADTDIGVSVDSILFPEVPIALRLSSHLLLGVVRIYSKKVNYLFHDCSEALLNIKQAFRSTAVDLPPEESTAPYHSITLPETFDLDDFELPDNGLFEGNFVDHHISSREQITLQDSLNGMAYLTSQFGPDERFGDGDASQLGLEIDENLFVDKVQTPLDPTDLLAPEEHEEPEVFGQAAATLSEMDIDEPVVQDGMHGQPVQSPDLNNALPSEPIEADPNVVEGICPVKSPSSESAQAPSTPGLLQEAIPANFHDGPTLSPLRKMSPSNNVEGLMPDDGGVAHLENDPECKKPETNNGLIHSLESDSCMVDQNHAMDLGGNLSASDNDMSNSVQGGPELVNPNLGSDTRNLPLDDQTQSVDSLQEFHRVDLPPDSLDSVPQSSRCMDNVEDVEDPNPSWRMLQPCSSLLKEADALPAGDNELVGAFDSENAPLDVQGGRKSSANVMDANSESAQMLKSSLAGMDADFDKADVPPKDAQLEILNHETNSNLLPPESFVSAPPIVVEVPIDVVPLSGEVEIANGIEKGDESFGDFTGKKRKVMESTPVLQNDDSAKLSGVPRSKKSVGFIPNDDDVLASILVGRRTPSLKLRPTPPTVEATSSKRTRLMPRTSVSKRKVLVDDTMVMHGDVIRQQLTNTEDIRRVRRKAPCTRIEFWMIEKSFLEDEMFTESVFSGVSSEVSSLLNREYDVIENTEFSRNAEAVLEANVQHNDSSLAVPSERSNGEVHQLCAISSPNDKQTNECDSNPLPLDAQDQVETKTGSFTLDSLENCHSLDLTTSGKEAQHCGNADTAEHMDSQVNDISCSITEKLVVETFNSFAELNDENLDARVDKVAITGEENNECTESGADNVAITGAELNDENLNASVDKETITEKENSECTEVRANVTGEENGKCAFQVEIDTRLITNDALITEYRKAADSFDALQPLLQEDRNASGETKFGISSGPNMPRDSSSTVENVDHTRPEDVDMEVGELPEYATKGVDAVNVGETSEEKHCSSPTCPNEPEMDREKHSPDNKELPGIQEIGQEGDMAVQMLSEAGTNNLSPMFEENNTEFLNVDDEAEPVEEEDNYTSTEQDQFFENSGWSSRTRAVARYLKSLFDNEVGHGRKVVAVDNLLAGKTRKEASRMFFETLVLKTKDYIQVEQDNSFGNINIKPRGKLVKSDF